MQSRNMEADLAGNMDAIKLAMVRAMYKELSLLKLAQMSCSLHV